MVSVLCEVCGPIRNSVLLEYDASPSRATDGTVDDSASEKGNFLTANRCWDDDDELADTVSVTVDNDTADGSVAVMFGGETVVADDVTGGGVPEPEEHVEGL